MTAPSPWKTKEPFWIIGTLAVCADATKRKVITGMPNRATACTVVGHNKGDVRPGYDFAAKLCSFAAATFAFFAGLGGVWLSWMLPNPDPGHLTCVPPNGG